MSAGAPAQPTRRQLSLFLPAAQRARVEPVRRRLDPIQHALIPAHVTLCRDDELPDPGQLTRRLEGLGPFRITLTFAAPRQLPDGCVLLRPRSGVTQIQALRRSILGPSARAYRPHLTLLHPRHSRGVRCDLAELARDLAGLVVKFDTLSLIEQCGGDPWQVKGVYGAAI